MFLCKKKFYVIQMGQLIFDDETNKIIVATFYCNIYFDFESDH